MAVRIPLYLISHHRKIAYLYRRWLRNLEGVHKVRTNYLYDAAIARTEFEAIYCEKDMIKSKRMLQEKEAELKNTFVIKMNYFPTSPEGPDYERRMEFNDSCLDYWHKYEKAAYPEYFARREIRKQQYIELWEKMHGPPKPDEYVKSH